MKSKKFFTKNKNKFKINNQIINLQILDFKFEFYKFSNVRKLIS